MKNLIKEEKGVVLIFAFVFIVALSAVVTVYLTLITRETKSTGIQRDDKAAFYIAEAGLQKARWAIGTGSPLPWQESNTLGSGSYSTSAVDNGDGTVTIMSEGYIPNALDYRIRRGLVEQDIPVSGGTTNIAQGEAISASSSAPGKPASNANDGKLATYWKSANGVNSWLSIDFGTATSVNEVAFYERNSNIADYTVEYSSDGSVWTQVSNLVKDVSTATFDSISERYVRLRITGLLPGSTNVEIKELEMFSGGIILDKGTFAEFW